MQCIHSAKPILFLAALADVSGAALADARTELGPLRLTKQAKLHQVRGENKEEGMTGTAVSYHKLNG